MSSRLDKESSDEDEQNSNKDIKEETRENDENDSTNIVTKAGIVTGLDRLIRGKGEEKYNRKDKNKVRFDKNSKKWYLKLSALDVKEIRAKIWQYQIGQN